MCPIEQIFVFLTNIFIFGTIIHKPIDGFNITGYVISFPFYCRVQWTQQMKNITNYQLLIIFINILYVPKINK